MDITYDEWVDKFQPIVGDNGDVRMFETYGDDYEIVKNTEDKYLWTWTDGGDYSCITNGFSYVNRLVYYITTVPWTEDVFVDMYEPDECEVSGHEYEIVERYDGNKYECCKYCGEDKEYLESFDD